MEIQQLTPNRVPDIEVILGKMMEATSLSKRQAHDLFNNDFGEFKGAVRSWERMQITNITFATTIGIANHYLDDQLKIWCPE